MKALRVIGFVLIIIGIIMMVTGGISFRQKKKLIDTNAVDISTKETKTISWPRVTGAIVLVGGVVILLMTGNKGNLPGKNDLPVD